MVWTLLDSILSPQQHYIIGHYQKVQRKPYFGQHQQTKTLQNYACCFLKIGNHNRRGKININDNTPSKIGFVI